MVTRPGSLVIFHSPGRVPGFWLYTRQTRELKITEESYDEWSALECDEYTWEVPAIELAGLDRTFVSQVIP